MKDAPHYKELRDWEVFARHKEQEAIQHVGMVRAADPEDARTFAYVTYDEKNWVEMFIAPRDAVVRVIPVR